MTLTSLWEHSRPDSPVGSSPEPLLGGHTDVAVVGGGITGVTTALLLARAGRSVTLVEGRRLGAGTTGRSTAKVSLLQGTQLSSIAGRHGRDVVADYVTANREGQAWLGRFCEDHGVVAEVRPALTYATTDSGLRKVEAEHAVAEEAGLPVRWVSGTELPYAVRGATRLEEQLQVDPLAVLHALAREAEAAGARFVEGVRVQTVRGSGPYRLRTAAGTLTAGTVVLATNSPILDRGGFFARIKPARSYALAFRTPTPAVSGMYLSADPSTRSLRDATVDGDDLLLVGGEGHTTGRGGSTARRLDTLRAWTAQHFGEAEETHAWSAQDYTPVHSLPYVGPLLPGSDGILMAGGFSKWGMTNGVAAALALSSRLLGGRADWARAMTTWSRRELSGVGAGLQVNGEVGLEMTRGWIRPLLRVGAGSPPAEGQGVVRLDRPGAPTAHACVDGEEHRVSAVCTHLGGVLAWNDAEQSWDCPLHGSRFAPDGSVLEGPATRGLGRRR